MRHWLTTAIALALAAAPAAAQVKIALRETVAVDRVFYTLADIADARAVDPQLQKRIRGYRLGRSPRVGQIDGVTRADIGARLERAFPGLQRRIAWRGPPVTRVQGTGRSVDSREYGAEAESFLNAWLAARFDRFDATRLDARHPVTVPLGELDMRPRVRDGAHAKRRMSVWLDFYVDGIEVATVPVWFGVSASRDGFVAGHDLEAGERLRVDAAVAATIDVAAGCAPPADESWFAGRHRLVRAVAAGEALCAANLQPLPAVARGEALTVTAHAGPVTVKALATALSDGATGDVIDVRRALGGRRFSVRVTGDGQAVVTGGSDE